MSCPPGQLSLLGTVALSVRRRACFRKDFFACFKTSDPQLQCFRNVWVQNQGAASMGLLLQKVSQAKMELVQQSSLDGVQQGKMNPCKFHGKGFGFESFSKVSFAVGTCLKSLGFVFFFLLEFSFLLLLQQCIKCSSRLFLSPSVHAVV